VTLALLAFLARGRKKGLSQRREARKEGRRNAIGKPFLSSILALLAFSARENQNKVSRKDAKIAKVQKCFCAVFLGVLGESKMDRLPSVSWIPASAGMTKRVAAPIDGEAASMLKYRG